VSDNAEKRFKTGDDDDDDDDDDRNAYILPSSFSLIRSWEKIWSSKNDVPSRYVIFSILLFHPLSLP
jgi:hypothetical protein